MRACRPGRVLSAAALVLFSVAACTEREDKTARPPVGDDGIALKRIPVKQLPGWSRDTVTDALPALKRACGALAAKPADAPVGPGGLAGRVRQWRGPCTALRVLEGDKPAALRRVLTSQFAAYAVRGPDGRTGTFTGYYTATLDAARERGGAYQHPIYRTPDDLVRASLGRFDSGLDGKRLIGRVADGRFVPYYPRKKINQGALAGRGLAFLWADSRIDTFFLHIQGSGVARLPDGERQPVGFAASNGRDFTGVGGYLLEHDMIPPSQASMQGVRRWLENNPDKARRVMNENARYIFFQPREGPAAVGTLGTPLTPGRSLAVDRDRLPLGAPVWVATEHPTRGTPFRRLMVAQDTGKAIQGTVRGDIYFGTGEPALAKAGRMHADGRVWLLMPRAVARDRVASR